MFSFFKRERVGDVFLKNVSLLGDLLLEFPFEVQSEMADKDLLLAVERHIEQHNLNLNLTRDRIRVLKPAKFKMLAKSEAFKRQIAPSIARLKKDDPTFNWKNEEDLVGAVFVDRGPMIMVRCKRRRYGLTKKWVTETRLVTKNFA